MRPVRVSSALRVVGPVVAAATCAVLTGCSSTTTAPASLPSASAPMSAGMTTPAGTVMGAGAGHPAVPSEPARMVCSDEVRSDLAQALGLHTVPAGVAGFRGGQFRCRYTLPAGPLRLAVKDLPTAAATSAWFARRRHALPAVTQLYGLTSGAFSDSAGLVVVRKDDHVLTVDAHGLPARFGRSGERRDDFAYETASVILGCWTGD
jgi:hypothetical protein